MQDHIESHFIAELLNDPKAYYRVRPVLRDNGKHVFTDKRYAVVYNAIEDATGSGNEPDLLSVSESLSKRGMLDEVGGLSGLAEMQSQVISSHHVEQHAEQLITSYMGRKIKAIGDRISKAIDEGKNVREIGSLAVEWIHKTLELQSTGRIRHAKEFVTEALDTYEKASAGLDSTRIKCGLFELDEATGGWEGGSLIILAARPSTGKSNVAMSWIIEASKQVPVLFYSAEMTGLSVMQRMIGTVSGINDRKIKRGSLNQDEVTSMVGAANDIAEREIYMDDTAAKYIGDIEQEVRKMVRERKIGLVVVDYIGKLKTNRSRSRQEEIADISSKLKGMAKEHNIPIIALAQLNRNVEQRGGLPVLSDLRESGDIEQDADVIVFLHSFEREKQMCIPEGFGRYSGTSSEDKLCFVLAKQRTGPVCDLFGKFDRDSGRISSVE